MMVRLETIHGSVIQVEVNTVDCRAYLVAELPKHRAAEFGGDLRIFPSQRAQPLRRVFEYDGELRDVPRFVEVEREMPDIYLDQKTALAILSLR